MCYKKDFIDVKKIFRWLKHLQKSGCLTTGVEHFLVMFPSALLIANLTSTNSGVPIISLSTILFFCGVGTLIFIALTKGKIPFFLGPSFAYIGFTSFYVASVSNITEIAEVRSTIIWGYILAGIFLLCLSFLYRFKKIQKIVKFLFPEVVMGPAISMIGLELADLAASDAGFLQGDNSSKILALFTLAVIIMTSLLKIKFLKNASVLFGIVSGCVFATMLGMINWNGTLEPVTLLKIPEMNFSFWTHRPENLLTLFIAVIPSAMVSFTENLGRIAVLEGMMRRDNIVECSSESELEYNSLKGHALADLLPTVLGAVPNTIYAENLAIMNLKNSNVSTKPPIANDGDSFVNECYAPYTVIPYVIGALLSVFVACFGGLQSLFTLIPKPVFGGMEFFIFGLITAPGIQLLVEHKVDYKRVSNQIITASVLLAGVSSLSLNLKIIELKGMSLGLVIGVILNLITKLLEYFGWLNERMGILEIIDICLDSFQARVSLVLIGNPLYSKKEMPYKAVELKKIIRKKEQLALILSADTVELRGENEKKIVRIHQNYDKIVIEAPVDSSRIAELCNDYENVIAINGSNQIQIIVTSSTSAKFLRMIVNQ